MLPNWLRAASEAPWSSGNAADLIGGARAADDDGGGAAALTAARRRLGARRRSETTAKGGVLSEGLLHAELLGGDARLAGVGSKATVEMRRRLVPASSEFSSLCTGAPTSG